MASEKNCLGKYLLYIVIIAGQVWGSEPGTKGWEVLLSIIIIVLFNVCYL